MSTVYKLVRDNRQIQLGNQLGRGGEATVYDVVGQPDMVVKIKHQPLSVGDLQKLETMVAQPPEDPTRTKLQHHSIAWPVAVVAEQDGSRMVPVGFVMPKMQSSVTLAEVINPRQRERIAPHFDYRFLLNVGKNLAIVVKNIHAKGHVIGDMNTLNVMVTLERELSTMITVIDCDSFQIATGSGRVFRCSVGKPEFTAPEIQNRSFSQFDRTEQHDMFAFAVIMYQLLMQNAHPFQGVPKRKDFDVDMVHVYNIAHGIFPHLDNPDMHRFPHSPSMMVLPAVLRDLFLRAFLPGYLRPSAKQWVDALSACVNDHAACIHEPKHVVVRGHSCVICEWEMINQRRPRVGQPIRELTERDVPAKSSTIQPAPRIKPPQRPLLPLAEMEAHADTVAGRLAPPYPYQRVVLAGFDAFVIDGDDAVQGFSVVTGTATPPFPNRRERIELAASKTCVYALGRDGQVAAWGIRSGAVPIVATDGQRLTAIAAGEHHLVGLTDSGTVVTYGNTPPVPPDVRGILQIAAGATHTCAMSAERVWIWGASVGSSAARAAQIDARPLTIAADADSTVVLTTNGEVHFITDTVQKSLAVNIERNLIRRVSIAQTTVFVHLTNQKVLSADMLSARRFEYHKIRDPLAEHMVDVVFAADMCVIQSRTHLALLRTTNFGATASKGRTVSYQSKTKGFFTTARTHARTALQLAQFRLRHVPQITAGASFSAQMLRGELRTTKGIVMPKWTAMMSISAGRDFVVGIDDVRSVAVATQNAGLAARVPPELTRQTAAVAAGAAHIVAASGTGFVYAWGANDRGQTEVPAGVRDAVMVAAGAAHSLALLANGTVVAWGDDRYGQAKPPPELTNVVAIWAGSNASAAVDADGVLWMWGELAPQSALTYHGLAYVVSVALGEHFGIVLFADGSMVGWGKNTHGQATPPRPSQPVVAIACGAAHAMALCVDGTVIGWGDNSQSQTLFA